MQALGYRLPTWIAVDAIKRPQPQAPDDPVDVGDPDPVIVDGLPVGSIVWIVGAAVLAIVVFSKGK
jgi:hypothetical protein